MHILQNALIVVSQGQVGLFLDLIGRIGAPVVHVMTQGCDVGDKKLKLGEHLFEDGRRMNALVKH